MSQAGSTLPSGVRGTAQSAGSLSPEFVGFWESWSDTNREDAFHRLGSVPASVTTTDVAFSIADSNEIRRRRILIRLAAAHGGSCSA